MFSKVNATIRAQESEVGITSLGVLLASGGWACSSATSHRCRKSEASARRQLFDMSQRGVLDHLEVVMLALLNHTYVRWGLTYVLYNWVLVFSEKLVGGEVVSIRAGRLWRLWSSVMI